MEDHSLATRYPRTVAAFQSMGALDQLAQISRLDTTWTLLRSEPSAISRHTACNTSYEICRAPLECEPPGYDLIYAGGGVGLIHAAIMAKRYGYRVLLFDRGEVGCAQREWNISHKELAALVKIGLFSWEELAQVIMARYDAGVVRFYAGDDRPSELWLRDVLDIALDAAALQQLARRKLEAAGGVVLDRREFRKVLVNRTGATRVLVEVAGEDARIERYSGRLLLDGMGSTSPLAIARFGAHPFAGVCPTVGTIATGFIEGDAANMHNRRIGDILISVADAKQGQQYMWEGFPGRTDHLTIYLFYYDSCRRAEQDTFPKPNRAPSLLELFEDYFALLPTYKLPGPNLRHLKPVYGYIPARHSVRRQEAQLLRGVLPIGDSAAQQSPLTFCGFGSHVRNLARTTSLLDEALHGELTEPRHLRLISAYQINVSLNWVFSRFMQPWSAANDVNNLQNIFLDVLNACGTELAQRFFRDQMRWGDYHRIVLGTFWRYPRIFPVAWKVLGSSGIRQWMSDYLIYSIIALLAHWGRQLGPNRRTALICALKRMRPGWGLWLRAHFAEWQTMGWI